MRQDCQEKSHYYWLTGLVLQLGYNTDSPNQLARVAADLVGGGTGLGHPGRPVQLLDLGYLSHLVAIGVVAIALRCKFGITTKKDECVACILVC